jgi:serine/threonine protein kinase
VNGPGLLPPGARLPGGALGERYVVKAPLGHGGMAAVYLVDDTVLGVERAAKVLAPDLVQDPSIRARFLDEARAMARLDHRNVVRVYDVLDAAAVGPVLVMEYCAGGTVRRWLGPGPLPLEHVVLVGRHVLAGLHAAHAAGIVHRDVKPGNFLVHRDGVVKVSDFGIARLAGISSSSLTRTGEFLGTVVYAAPEQRMDARSVGPAADVYGVGAALYQLASGREPPDLSVASLKLSVLDVVPAPLRPFLLTACAYRPEERFPSAAAAAAALRQIAG